MSSAELNRLFGKGDCGGSGPSTWGRDGLPTQRKAHYCEVHRIHYSVEVGECPRCTEARLESRMIEVSHRVARELADERAVTMARNKARLAEQRERGRQRKIAGLRRRLARLEAL